VVVPATMLLEWVLRAGEDTGCPVVTALIEEAPLVLPAAATVEIQVTVGPADDTGGRAVTVYARTGDDLSWTCHATAILAARDADGTTAPDLPVPWPPPGASPVDLDELREAVADSGYEPGPAFRTTRAVWRRGHDLFAEVALPGFEAATWFALVAPAGTPRDIVLRLNSEVTRLVGQAEVRQRFADLGMTVDAATPDALDGYIKTEIAKWSKVIKDADIRAPE